MVTTEEKTTKNTGGKTFEDITNCLKLKKLDFVALRGGGGGVHG